MGHPAIGTLDSRGGLRMADTASHPVNRVLPEVTICQWVIADQFADAQVLADQFIEKIVVKRDHLRDA